MTEDKERDDALIAEAERLATKATQSTTKSLAWIEECQSALIHLVRSNWQPAPKPDRAEVLAQALWDQWTLKASEVIDAQSLINDAFNELRAEWEAERLHGTDWFKGEVDCDGNELVTVSKDALDRYKDQARYTYQRAEKAEARVKELEAERPAVVVPREEQIKQMVTRFLGWKLPVDFYPDDGISFEPFFNVEWNAKQGKPPQRRTPTGTNLFTSTQAEAMVRYMLGDDT